MHYGIKYRWILSCTPLSKLTRILVGQRWKLWRQKMASQIWQNSNLKKMRCQGASAHHVMLWILLNNLLILKLVQQIWLQKSLEIGVSGLRSTTFVIVYRVPHLLLCIEYHICYYVSNCSSWSVVFKSYVCHLGKPGVIPVFKMVSKTAISYRNAPRNTNACPFSFYA